MTIPNRDRHIKYATGAVLTQLDINGGVNSVHFIATTDHVFLHHL
jgi:hypothetical protein